MGQKVNPNVMRKGIVTGERLNWYAEGKNYTKLLHEDLKIIKYLMDMKRADISKVLINRPANKIEVSVHAVRPAIIIGKKGAGIEKVKKTIQSITKHELSFNVIEERKPEISALLVASNVAKQLEGRVSFRKAMKRAMQSSRRMGAKGIKIEVSGRLNGAEIARREWYREGRVPLHTFRSKVEFAKASAHTTYGVIGVKVWIYLGDKMEKVDNNNLDTRFGYETAQKY